MPNDKGRACWIIHDRPDWLGSDASQYLVLSERAYTKTASERSTFLIGTRRKMMVIRGA